MNQFNPQTRPLLHFASSILSSGNCLQVFNIIHLYASRKKIMIKISSLVLIVAVAACCPLLSTALNYTLCDIGKTSVDIKDVKVSDCETLKDACPFVRGFNKSIEMDFVPNRKLEQVKVRVAGKLKALAVPFNINPDKACGNYGFDCPLEAGKAYKFKLTLPIMRTYPKINVDVLFRLVDEKDDVISCVEIPARIQEPQKD